MSLNTYQHIPYPLSDSEELNLEEFCKKFNLPPPDSEELNLEEFCKKWKLPPPVVEELNLEEFCKKWNLPPPVVEVKSEVVASVAVPVNRLMHDYDNDDIMPDEDDVILDDESDIYEPDEDDDEVRVYIDEPVSACVSDEDEYNPYTMGWDIILN
jgi:hypothetical protein